MAIKKKPFVSQTRKTIPSPPAKASTPLFKFKTSLLTASIFLVGLLACDRGLGLWLTQQFSKTMISDDTMGNVFNQAIHANTDAYILGDSRAKYHYNPRPLQLKTGLSFFNAGVVAQDVFCFRMGTDVLEQFHQPKLYLVELSTYVFDIQPNQYLGALTTFAPYRHRTHTFEQLLEIEKHANHPRLPYLLKIKSYSFRSHLFPILRQLVGQKPAHPDGFEAKSETLDPRKLPLHRNGLAGILDEVKVMQFIDFVKQSQSKGIRVVVCVGPMYRWDSNFVLWQSEWYYLRCIRQLCKLLAVPLIEISEAAYPEYRDPTYYMDQNHLNKRGAELFSHQVADHLRTILTLPNMEAFYASPYFPQIDPADYPLPLSK